MVFMVGSSIDISRSDIKRLYVDNDGWVLDESSMRMPLVAFHYNFLDLFIAWYLWMGHSCMDTSRTRYCLGFWY